jgi:hypothetical protein
MFVVWIYLQLVLARQRNDLILSHTHCTNSSNAILRNSLSCPSPKCRDEIRLIAGHSFRRRSCRDWESKDDLQGDQMAIAGPRSMEVAKRREKRSEPRKA